MSVLVAVPGSPQPPDSVALTSSSLETVKTFAAGSTGVAFITSVAVANNTASPVQTKLYWTDDTSDYLFYTNSIAANSSVTNALDGVLAFNARSSAKKIKAIGASGVVVTVFHNLLNQQNG